MNRIVWLIMLSVAMALTTWGIVGWAELHFALDPLWPFSGPFLLHPVHLIGIGLALLPLAFTGSLQLTRQGATEGTV